MRPAATTLLLLCLTGCSGCDGQPATPSTPKPHAADDLLLVLDGVRFTWGEVQPFVAFYDSLYPDWGQGTKVKKALDNYLIPLKFARTEFAAQRQEKLSQAKALRSVADNVVDLQQKASNLLSLRKNVTVGTVELPVAMFLFERANIGATSQPIELPQGYAVVGAIDITDSKGKMGGAIGDDVCDAFQVTFYTHEKGSWFDWLDKLHTRLATKATQLNPDFRDAIPEWIKLP